MGTERSGRRLIVISLMLMPAVWLKALPLQAQPADTAAGLVLQPAAYRVMLATPPASASLYEGLPAFLERVDAP